VQNVNSDEATRTKVCLTPHFDSVVHKARSLEGHGDFEEMQPPGSGSGAVSDKAICQTCREILLYVLLVLFRRRYFWASLLLSMTIS
jgi:hypothetical protein